MNKYIIAIFLIIILLFVFNNNKAFLDNFVTSNSSKTTYTGTGDFPAYFKLGEINIKRDKYDEYLNKIHNDHLKRKISKFNYDCKDCQRLNN